MSGLTKQLVDDLSTKDKTYGGVYLEINMTQLFSVNNLDAHLNIQQLSNVNFAVNMLKEIEPVFLKCGNLRVLDLSINHITEIQNLDSCSNLIELNLSKNQISLIRNLESLVQLKELNLSMNRIMRIQNLESQMMLEKLILYGNQIEYLEGLEEMRGLKELLVNRNKLRSLNYLASVPNLQGSINILNASYNLLPEEELDNIAHVTLTLYNLKRLDLYGNDVFNNPGYKFRLTENSSLDKLDGLDVKGVIKDRLDNLRRDWQVNQLVEETSEEAKKWIEAERELKSVALNILSKKQERLTSDFESYKKAVDDDLLNFITYISDLKHQRNQGISDKITFDKLQTWKSSVERQENSRIQMLEEQLHRLEEKRRDTIDETVTTTNFLDKLYEVSMQMPEVWGGMKGQEYQNAQYDQRGTPSRANQGDKKFQQNQQQIEKLMAQGMKTLGNKMKQDINEEVEQAKFDFEDQSRLENAAENRSKYNQQFLSNNDNKSSLRGTGGNLKPTTPQKYENDAGKGSPNLSAAVGRSFLDQFKSDPKPKAGYDLNQSVKGGQKRDPIPIEFGEAQSKGGSIKQKSNPQGIRASQEEPAPPNKDTKACIIY